MLLLCLYPALGKVVYVLGLIALKIGVLTPGQQHLLDLKHHRSRLQVLVQQLTHSAKVRGPLPLFEGKSPSHLKSVNQQWLDRLLG